MDKKSVQSNLCKREGGHNGNLSISGGLFLFLFCLLRFHTRVAQGEELAVMLMRESGIGFFSFLARPPRLPLVVFNSRGTSCLLPSIYWLKYIF